MAKGSAAMQEIINTMEVNPWAVINSFEMRLAREEGALLPGSSWTKVSKKGGGEAAP